MSSPLNDAHAASATAIASALLLAISDARVRFTSRIVDQRRGSVEVVGPFADRFIVACVRGVAKKAHETSGFSGDRAHKLF
jgi:hypothetical protein